MVISFSLYSPPQLISFSSPPSSPHILYFPCFHLSFLANNQPTFFHAPSPGLFITDLFHIYLKFLSSNQSIQDPNLKH